MLTSDVASVALPDGDGDLFWDCSLPPLLYSGTGLPGLSSRTVDASWAVAAVDVSVNELD